MAWLLVAILIEDGTIFTKALGIYPSMGHCFEVREYVMQQSVKPKLNYETVCIQTNELNQL
jgi:hypothetical protein